MLARMSSPTAEGLVSGFLAVRGETERLAARLSDEDQQVQSMPACSPTKWHRAHTTWFFETFVLVPRGVSPVDDRYSGLFNSYYNAIGPQFSRAERGLLTRPSVAEVASYRRVVDGRVVELLGALDAPALAEIRPLIELGLAHEQQHQELLLTDILHTFSRNPLGPAYHEAPRVVPGAAPAGLVYQRDEGGLVACGAEAGRGFAFDNELPRHQVFLAPFELATRLVTWAEVAAFVADGGYQTPSLWLSDGWDMIRAEGLRAPLYSRLEDGQWRVFSLHGERTPSPAEPACHLSYYEADALARYLGGRLPTEAEWEHVAARSPSIEPAPDGATLHARPAPAAAGMQQLWGAAWQWTSSAYAAYPGYRPGAGALGEYNGKFMSGQQVLRGGSCLTPFGHGRATYRNFWPPGTRFQMTGARVARDA
jgi:ergothioneine biosynthesis protein EgtB